MIQFLNEAKIKQGETFKLAGNIGTFKKGEQVTVYNIKHTQDDVEIHLKNSKGVKDVLYMDKSDNFDDLKV
jgi:hypothetical protein